uniref:Uncharacterized protein n=1 Tax=Rhizophagus irregularis (strain DAOM 181602 / DAOM 197198 / MUCL 43194) TaxID=747089 RepID=U9TIK6_RHIID
MTDNQSLKKRQHAFVGISEPQKWVLWSFSLCFLAAFGLKFRLFLVKVSNLGLRKCFRSCFRNISAGRLASLCRWSFALMSSTLHLSPGGSFLAVFILGSGAASNLRNSLLNFLLGFLLLL